MHYHCLPVKGRLGSREDDTGGRLTRKGGNERGDRPQSRRLAVGSWLKLDQDNVCVVTRDYVVDPVRGTQATGRSRPPEPAPPPRLTDEKLAHRFLAAATFIRELRNVCLWKPWISTGPRVAGAYRWNRFRMLRARLAWPRNLGRVRIPSNFSVVLRSE